MATVLIVESDPFQGSLRKSILERHFPDVVRVADAAGALCLVERPKFAGRLGLLVSSQSMLGIGCLAFVAEFHKRLPEIPVLVLGDACSRPAGEPAAGSAQDSAAPWIRFLARPFSPEQLARLACQMLPGPASRLRQPAH